VLAWFPITK